MPPKVVSDALGIVTEPPPVESFSVNNRIGLPLELPKYKLLFHIPNSLAPNDDGRLLLLLDLIFIDAITKYPPLRQYRCIHLFVQHIHKQVS